MPFDGYQPEQPKLEEWQRVLLRAADLIEHCGWTRAELEDRRGFCALGAILMAMMGRLRLRTIDEAERFNTIVARTGFDHPNGLARWNDRDCCSAEQLVGLLRTRALDRDYVNERPTWRRSESMFMSAPTLSGNKAHYLWVDDLMPPVSSHEVDAMQYLTKVMVLAPNKVVSNFYAWT